MEIKYIIDTSAYSSYFVGDPRLKDYFDESSIVYMPIIVVGELRAGFAAGSKRDYNERYLQQFLDNPKVRVINLSDKTSEYYASIFATLKQADTPIGSNDMWIAALALEYDCLLVTLDTDFKRVPDLLVGEV